MKYEGANDLSLIAKRMKRVDGCLFKNHAIIYTVHLRVMLNCRPLEKLFTVTHIQFCRSAQVETKRV